MALTNINTINNSSSRDLFIYFIVVIVIAGVLITLWSKAIKNLTYHTLHLDEKSFMVALMMAIIFTIIFFLFIYFVPRPDEGNQDDENLINSLIGLGPGNM